MAEAPGRHLSLYKSNNLTSSSKNLVVKYASGIDGFSNRQKDAGNHRTPRDCGFSPEPWAPLRGAATPATVGFGQHPWAPATSARGTPNTAGRQPASPGGTVPGREHCPGGSLCLATCSLHRKQKETKAGLGGTRETGVSCMRTYAPQVPHTQPSKQKPIFPSLRPLSGNFLPCCSPASEECSILVLLCPATQEPGLTSSLCWGGSQPDCTPHTCAPLPEGTKNANVDVALRCPNLSWLLPPSWDRVRTSRCSSRRLINTPGWGWGAVQDPPPPASWQTCPRLVPAPARRPGGANTQEDRGNTRARRPPAQLEICIRSSAKP